MKRNQMTDKPALSVLNIGNELLSGSTINRNLSLIGQKFAEFGIEPEIQLTVPDDPEKIAISLKILSSKPGLIVSTGGLGPTSDDLTKKVIADFFGLKLKYSKEIEKHIRNFWKRRTKAPAPKSIFNQAEVISNAEIIKNDNGTAPAFIIRDKKRKIIMLILPGPPLEAMPILEKYIKKLIVEAELPQIHCRKIFTSGLPESIIENITKSIISKTPSIIPAYCASSEGVRIYLKSKNCKMLNQIADKLEKKLGNNKLSENANNIFEELIMILKDRMESLSIAESCTGGLISKKITDIPGASAIFKGAIVSYSNSVKNNLLNVATTTLKQFGAVSSQCAKEMLYGTKEIFKTDAAISVTGIAGPDGGTKTKPIGLVFIGTNYKNKSEIRKYNFNGSREQIRERATAAAINQLKDLLLETSPV